MKLIDTSVAVDHLRGFGRATALLEELVQSDERLVASELTQFELLSGIRTDEGAALERFSLVVDWVPVLEDVSRQAGAYARSYRRSHSGIGAVDYLIAATASVLGAGLLTVNVRHFPMFEDLEAPYSYD